LVAACGKEEHRRNKGGTKEEQRRNKGGTKEEQRRNNGTKVSRGNNQSICTAKRIKTWVTH
jgi:hypothetical protein